MSNFPTITPGILYHNAPEMIEWLCNTFGFVKKLIIPGKDNRILHAHLTFGNGGIMLSSAENYAFPELCTSPVLTGVGTVEIIVYVVDIEEHYNQAKEAGAEIIIPLEDKGYGGKGYSCKDPEGHVWAFGSYNPWA